MSDNNGVNAHHPEVFHTRSGIPYLKEPGIVLISQPQFMPQELQPFIEGFGAFDAEDYVNDFYTGATRAESPWFPLKIDHGAALAKFAGQLCYLSFGEQRSRNADAAKYLTNIKDQQHGSVLEHANYSFLFYGIDRSCTHELVRHRAGFAYSQVSQRYVSGKMLRFVERPEYQNNETLHSMFEDRIEYAAMSYNLVAEHLMANMPGRDQMAKTDARKAVNQTARSGLPNEAEAPICVTGNVRAWRHFIEMRASKYAEPLIRKLAYNTQVILEAVAPLFFDDYEHVDDTNEAMPIPSLTTKYRKV